MHSPSSYERGRSIAIARLGLVVALAGAACVSSHEERSTETGNPPVIDPALVALVVSADEVHVRGEPGAVTPGGIEVEVATIGASDVLRGPVAADGSFDVRVAASPDDAFTVRAIRGGASSNPVYVLRGGAAVGDAEAGLRCEERIELASRQIDHGAGQADARCTRAEDCTTQQLAMSCHASCEHAVVSEAGRASLLATFEGLERGLCADFQADGCEVQQSPCPGPPPAGSLACVNGRCQRSGVPDPGTDAGASMDAGPDPLPDCSTCLDAELSWGLVGFPTASTPELDESRYTLTGCGEFELRTRGGLSCETALPLCDEGDGDAWGLQDLLRRLVDPEVDAAFDSAEYWNRAPGPDEAYIQIQYGSRTLRMTRECVDGAPCNPAPPGLSDLLDVLEQVADQQRCRPAECLLAYDEGDGSDAQAVYAFDPPSMSCVLRPYSGSGGNANRFETYAACSTSCPGPLGDPGCPPNRIYLEDACVAPSPLGGCAQTSRACALACSGNDQCADDSLGPVCTGRNVCERWSPL